MLRGGRTEWALSWRCMLSVPWAVSVRPGPLRAAKPVGALLPGGSGVLITIILAIILSDRDTCYIYPHQVPAAATSNIFLWTDRSSLGVVVCGVFDSDLFR